MKLSFDDYLECLINSIILVAAVTMPVFAVVNFERAPLLSLGLIAGSIGAVLLLPWSAWKARYVSSGHNDYALCQQRDKRRAYFTKWYLRVLLVPCVLVAYFEKSGIDQDVNRQQVAAVQNPEAHPQFEETITKDRIREILQKEEHELSGQDRIILSLAGLEPGSAEWMRLRAELQAIETLESAALQDGSVVASPLDRSRRDSEPETSLNDNSEERSEASER